MRSIHDLSRDEEDSIIEQIRDALWPKTEGPDYQWSPDTLNQIADIFREYDLAPDDYEGDAAS